MSLTPIQYPWVLLADHSLFLCPERHDVGRFFDVRAPRVHKLPPLLQGRCPAVGLLHFITYGVRQGHFRDVAREARFVPRPITEAGPAPMRGHIGINHLQRVKDRIHSERLARFQPMKNEVVRTGILRKDLLQDRQGAVT